MFTYIFFLFYSVSSVFWPQRPWDSTWFKIKTLNISSLWVLLPWLVSKSSPASSSTALKQPANVSTTNKYAAKWSLSLRRQFLNWLMKEKRPGAEAALRNAEARPGGVPLCHRVSRSRRCGTQTARPLDPIWGCKCGPNMQLYSSSRLSCCEWWHVCERGGLRIPAGVWERLVATWTRDISAESFHETHVDPRDALLIIVTAIMINKTNSDKMSTCLVSLGADSVFLWKRRQNEEWMRRML